MSGKIFYWFVFEDMSSYDIAKELNAVNVPSPSESYEMRKYGEIKRKTAVLEIGRYQENPSESSIYWMCRLWENKAETL